MIEKKDKMSKIEGEIERDRSKDWRDVENELLQLSFIFADTKKPQK